MSDKAFVDSNVLLYLADTNDSVKKPKADAIVAVKPFITAQVVFECLNVCLKKFRLPKHTAIDFATNLFKTCNVIGEERETAIFAVELFSKYSLQVFDSKIVAAALDTDCSVLYSEDMQHGLVIENRLTIVNPFL